MGNDGGKILFIEDQLDEWEMLQLVLPEYEMIFARSMTEGVSLAREHKFLLILLDYCLPDGNGDEACSIIRTFDDRTPILFVTGSRSFTERMARSIGAQGMVKKASPTFIEQIQSRTRQLALA